MFHPSTKFHENHAGSVYVTLRTRQLIKIEILKKNTHSLCFTANSIQQAHAQESFDSTETLEMKIPLPHRAKITHQTGKGEKKHQTKGYYGRDAHTTTSVHTSKGQQT